MRRSRVAKERANDDVFVLVGTDLGSDFSYFS